MSPEAFGFIGLWSFTYQMVASAANLGTTGVLVKTASAFFGENNTVAANGVLKIALLIKAFSMLAMLVLAIPVVAAFGPIFLIVRALDHVAGKAVSHAK